MLFEAMFSCYLIRANSPATCNLHHIKLGKRTQTIPQISVIGKEHGLKPHTTLVIFSFNAVWAGHTDV